MLTEQTFCCPQNPRLTTEAIFSPCWVLSQSWDGAEPGLGQGFPILGSRPTLGWLFWGLEPSSCKKAGSTDRVLLSCPLLCSPARCPCPVGVWCVPVAQRCASQPLSRCHLWFQPPLSSGRLLVVLSLHRRLKMGGSLSLLRKKANSSKGRGQPGSWGGAEGRAGCWGSVFGVLPAPPFCLVVLTGAMLTGAAPFPRSWVTHG